jgi:hypothetical protein
MDPVNIYANRLRENTSTNRHRFPLEEDDPAFEYHAEVFYDHTGRTIVTEEYAKVMGARAFNRGMWLGVIATLVLTTLVNIFFSG